MPREDWREQDRERYWRARERDPREVRGRDDYGQADYSDLYGYDARTRTGYRAYDDGRVHDRDEIVPPDQRSFVRRDVDYDRVPAARGPRRKGPSDRVLWAVIVERLEDERRLDTRDVEVDVRDGEVTLNGSVRRKEDKRRIEDVADIEGVRNVQNNLRVRERNWGLF
jgi:hypothetical protein